MTLLIAFLLLYIVDANVWAYFGTFALWIFHLWVNRSFALWIFHLLVNK